MSYDGITLTPMFQIEKLYSIHYFEYRKDFSFSGESHDFWEFVYVDKGDVVVTANDKTHLLKKGEVIFHAPNEFHAIRATGDTAPNIIVISFSCENDDMHFFTNQILTIHETERTALATIIAEAKQCFSCRLDDPYLQNMPLHDTVPFGSLQLISIYLEQFLIRLFRRFHPVCDTCEKSSSKALIPNAVSENDAQLFAEITNYLKAHLHETLSVEQICNDTLMGRTQLQKLLQNNCQMGIVEYCSLLKIESAKELIRMDKFNFTQIAEQLGYTSVHYFSRQFKKITGMSPTEYASSIKAMAEGSFDTN